jgi:hypothetical protein
LQTDLSALSGWKASFSFLIRLLRFPVQRKISQLTKKAAAPATIEKYGPAAAVKRQQQLMDVSKLTVP